MPMKPLDVRYQHFLCVETEVWERSKSLELTEHEQVDNSISKAVEDLKDTVDTQSEKADSKKLLETKNESNSQNPGKKCANPSCVSL